ncbi:MAG: alpha-xylosidase [Propionibacterium sp.]|nr:alpha-xylosidase [Propionibacterium sp.]
MPLPEYLHPAPCGAPDTSMTLSGDHWRIQVLTERLIRLEWSPSGTFEDRPTQMVADRGFTPVEARLTRTPRPGGEDVLVRTPHLTLSYDGEVFSTHGLSASVVQGAEWGGTWRWGLDDSLEDIHFRNLGGTARTLDGVDGRCALEPGVMDGRGVTALADPSPALTRSGWVEPREEGALDLYLFAHGRDFRGAIADFYRLTGPQPVIPRFALGNWWSRYHRYSEAEYRALLDTFTEHHVPLSVAVLDMDWHLVDLPEEFGSGWTGFTWNSELFPDPAGFATFLHERGLALTLNLHPAEGVRAFEEAYTRMAERLGIDPASGDPVVFDPSDPEGMAAYLEEVIAPLEDQGVDFWWIDWQQGSHTRVPGLDPLWILNHLHVLDSARRHDGRGLTLSRYAGPGSHRYPVGFSGDTVVSWASLAFQPEFTATASNIGYGWWSHDIGGHMDGVRDGELQTRWVQLGVFSPVLRLHSTNNAFGSKEPWRFAPRECAVQESFLRLRHRLVPYLHSEQLWGHEALQPLVQPMYWEDPDSRGAWEVPNQFMFGRSLLVAPVTTQASRVTDMAEVPVWLPQGTWVDLFSGLTYEGGRRITMHRRLESLPVLARPGTVLPLAGVDEDDPALDTTAAPQALEILVVAGADGFHDLVEDDGRSDGTRATTRLSWDDAHGVLHIHPVSGDASQVPRTRRVRVRVLGAAVAGTEPGSGPWASGGARSVGLSRVDPATGAVLGEVVEVDSATGIVVETGVVGDLAGREELEARARDLLERASCGLNLKVALMEDIASGSAARALSGLHARPAPEELRSALVELLAARRW